MAFGIEMKSERGGGVEQVAKIKKSKTAYNFFTMDEMKKVCAEMPGAGIGEWMPEVGKRWKAMEEDDKKQFVEMAAAAKKVYVAEVERMSAEQGGAIHISGVSKVALNVCLRPVSNADTKSTFYPRCTAS
jgi:hypothetical protein